jgi:F-type H+-transporting ATPase subunit b
LKVQLRWFGFLLLFASLSLWGGRAAFAQAEAPSAAAASSGGTHHPKDDNEETNEFRHAPIVQSLGHSLGLDTESAARIFEIVNSGILLFAIFFFLFKLVPGAIRSRNAALAKRLVEAREATEAANERLRAVEAKLARIGEDIEAIRQQNEREMAGDEKRIKESLEEERQRIVQSAEQEIESAGAAAKRDLKRFAAELAVDNAARRIQVSHESDKAMIERFGNDLTAQFGKGGRN